MSDQQTPELQGYCPVAYFAVGQALPGKPEYASTYQGKRYYFVSEEAKQTFMQNPEQYLAVFGGLCAFGMSIGKAFEPCPTNFKIIDGRLHLFLKNDETDALQLWNKEDEAKCLSNASQQWAERCQTTWKK